MRDEYDQNETARLNTLPPACIELSSWLVFSSLGGLTRCMLDLNGLPVGLGFESWFG